MTGTSFRDLDVWRLAMRLVEVTYEIARQLPADERYELSAQMRRAAVSEDRVPSTGYRVPSPV